MGAAQGHNEVIVLLMVKDKEKPMVLSFSNTLKAVSPMGVEEIYNKHYQDQFSK